MDTRILEENNQQCIKQYIRLKPSDVISTDGKTIMGAGERGDTCYVHMVTACQIKIAEKIIEKRARYILAVKENLRRFHEEIPEKAKMIKATGMHKEVNADHGRQEERICRVYRELSLISASWNWPKLSALVEVERRSF